MASGILKFFKKEGYDKKNIVIFGIPRGGVIVASIIAKRMEIFDFDILLSRKLRIPNSEENAFGAIMEDESVYLDDNIINSLVLSKEYIEQEKKNQVQEMKRRALLYRNSDSLIQFSSKLCDNCNNPNIILVDDGAATGATLIVTARWIRNRLEDKFNKLIIAIPVAPKDTFEVLKKECDHLEVIMQPSNFYTVGQFYKDFLPISDERIIDILNSVNVVQNNNNKIENTDSIH